MGLTVRLSSIARGERERGKGTGSSVCRSTAARIARTRGVAIYSRITSTGAQAVASLPDRRLSIGPTAADLLAGVVQHPSRTVTTPADSAGEFIVQQTVLGGHGLTLTIKSPPPMPVVGDCI